MNAGSVGSLRSRNAASMREYYVLVRLFVAAWMCSSRVLLVPAFTFNPVALTAPSSLHGRQTATFFCNTPHPPTSTRTSGGSFRSGSAAQTNVDFPRLSRDRIPTSSATACTRRNRTPCSMQLDASAKMPGSGEAGCDRLEFLKAAAKRTVVAATAGVVGATSSVGSGVGQPEAAEAFCGEPYPYWAYFTDFDEVFVPFEFEGYRGQLWIRTVGNQKEQKKADHNPLVLIPGGPGLPHDYLETLEGAAKDDRVVIAFDPIGTGNSSALPTGRASRLLGNECLVAQTNTVLDFAKRSLKLSAFHVLGHGTGASVALDMGRSFGRCAPAPPAEPKEKGVAAAVPDGVLSVTLASPILGGSTLPSDFLESLRAPYTRGGNEAPLCLETALQGKNADGFAEGLVSLRKGNGTKDVGPLLCPVLVTYGGQDIIGDKVVTDLKAALSGGDSRIDVQKFEGSGHLAHLDERENYVGLIQNYVASVDQNWSGADGDSKKK